jgi:hypothetical protein
VVIIGFIVEKVLKKKKKIGGKKCFLFSVRQGNEHHPVIQKAFLRSLFSALFVFALINRLIVRVARGHFALDQLSGNLGHFVAAT